MIRELAENANTHVPLGPGQERLVDDRYVIWFGAGALDPHGTVVQRLRLDVHDVETTVAEIRAAIAARGRSTCTWEVADSATPSDLVERLHALGCVPDREPVAIGMVLTSAPAGGPPDVVARRVQTLSEREASIRIAGEAFGMEGAAVEELLEHARTSFDPDSPNQVDYLAFVDGEPVASAVAVFTEHGVLLFGGATVERARGRGAYRALVRARWDDAVARGTPVLVTHAGAMSHPILAALGFRDVARIEILLDEQMAGASG